MPDRLIEALVITIVVILSLYITSISIEFIVKLIWKLIKQ
jgi:hypothetical protein